MNEEEKTLATELLHELKASAKRWFIIAIAELIVILSMIAGLFWYFSLPTEEFSRTEQTMEDVDTSGGAATQTIGGDEQSAH